MTNSNWTSENMPDLSEKVAIVTGANSGIGYETTLALAAKQATVIMACRNLEKAEKAAKEIRIRVPNAKLEIIQLDLVDLGSVRKFAKRFSEKYKQVNLLINNAGVMVPPFIKTKDGFELQFGANHLGHFALTGLLMPSILASAKARIVNVSSSAHRMGSGTIDFDNLNAEKGYNPPNAYAQSKLANLLFTSELNERLMAMGSDVTATAAHPGWTVSGLQHGALKAVSMVIGQSPRMGALPTLRAATDPDAGRTDYFGPSNLMEMRGHPVKVESSDAAKDHELAQRLWQVSEKLTGVEYRWPEHA